MNTISDPAEMIGRGAPRLIRSDAELDEYSKALFELTSKDRPTTTEQEAIDLLTLLIEHYETYRFPAPRGKAVDVLRLLLERNGVSQCTLTPEVGSQATASLLVLGKRQFTRSHIARLSKRFHVSPAVFFDEQSAIPLRRNMKKKKKPA